jgi:hypothetical protein
MYRHKEILKLLVVSADSSKDLENQEQESTIYEHEDVEHGNCKCCTSFAKSAELEKQRELWWKERRKREIATVTVATERDLWDPTIDVEDFQ